MGFSVDEREARELAEKHGVFVREARHGLLYRFPNGGLVCLPTGSPSDGARVWKNARGDVRRMLRASGVRFNDDHNEDEAKEEVVNEAVRAVPRVPGLHVERTKKVVEVDRVEATVDIPHLAAALGLEGVALDATLLVLKDVGGNEIEGPVTFVVEQRTERQERL